MLTRRPHKPDVGVTPRAPSPGAGFLYGRPVGGVAATMPRLLLQHALDSSLPGGVMLPHVKLEGLDAHGGPDLSLLGWPRAPASAQAGAGGGDQGLRVGLGLGAAGPGAPPSARVTSSSDEVMGSFLMYRSLQARLCFTIPIEEATGFPGLLERGHGPKILHVR